MNYLQPSEYESYGLESTTALSWVTVASAIIDGHCRRATLAVAQYTERMRTDSQQRPVQLTYLPLAAGLDPFPDAVKVACAQLVKNAQATPALNVKRNVVPDRMQLMYFSDSLLDATVQSLLAPYVAQRVG